MLTEAERTQGPLVPAILRGALAGALRELGRSDERVQSGLDKLAGHYSSVAAGLVTEWVEGAIPVASLNHLEG